MVNLGGFLGGAAGGAAISILIRGVDGFSDTFKKVDTEMAKMQKQALMVSGALLAFGSAGLMLGKNLTKIAADFEMTTIAFTTLLGSAKEAKIFLDELAQFAAKTPFSLKGVEDSAKRLMAVGFEAEEVLPVLKSVGDIAAGLGLKEEGLQRLILNLGQVQTQGKLTGRELRDFAVAGVPIYEALADQMGVATEAISGMVTAGEIASTDVISAFEKMTSAGGKFENMMDKMSKGTAGKINNLTDQIEILGRTMGKYLLPMVNTVVDAISAAVEVFNNMDDTIKKIVISIAAAAFAFALLAGAIIAVKIALPLLIGMLAAVNVQLLATVAAMTGLNITTGGLIAAVGVLAAGIFILISRFTGAKDELDKFKQAQSDLAEDIRGGDGPFTAASKEIDAYIEKLNLVTRLTGASTQEQIDADKEIVQSKQDINDAERYLAGVMSDEETKLYEERLLREYEEAGIIDSISKGTVEARLGRLKDELVKKEEAYAIEYTNFAAIQEQKSLIFDAEATIREDRAKEEVDNILAEYARLPLAEKLAAGAGMESSYGEVDTSNFEQPSKKNLFSRAMDWMQYGDFVVTPNGVIETSPDDYIFGTKNPGAMGGGASIYVENLYSSSPEEAAQAMKDELDTMDGGA